MCSRGCPGHVILLPASLCFQVRRLMYNLFHLLQDMSPWGGVGTTERHPSTCTWASHRPRDLKAKGIEGSFQVFCGPEASSMTDNVRGLLGAGSGRRFTGLLFSMRERLRSPSLHPPRDDGPLSQSRCRLPSLPTAANPRPHGGRALPMLRSWDLGPFQQLAGVMSGEGRHLPPCSPRPRPSGHASQPLAPPPPVPKHPRGPELYRQVCCGRQTPRNDQASMTHPARSLDDRGPHGRKSPPRAAGCGFWQNGTQPSLSL